MQIVDYASLQTAIGDWLNRSDLSTRAPDFIGFAEVRMMRDMATMRLLEKDGSLTGVPGSRFIAVPSDYRDPLNLWWDNGVDRFPLRYVPAELIDAFDINSFPVSWTVDGTNVAFDFPCDQAYKYVFRYRATLALSNTTPTNVLLTQYPDIYLFSSLVEASTYLKDSDALETWEARYQQALQGIREAEGRQKALTTLSIDAAMLPWRRGIGPYNINRDF